MVFMCCQLKCYGFKHEFGSIVVSVYFLILKIVHLKGESVSVQDGLLGGHSQSASRGLIPTLAVCKSST